MEFQGETTVSLGKIGKDENGEPNGLLFEIEACTPTNNQLMNLPGEVLRELQKNFLSEIAQYGITSVSDMAGNPKAGGVFTVFEIAKELEQSDELTARIHLYPSLGLDTDYSVADSLKEEYHSGMLQVSGLKHFVDGTTSTYSAYLLEPYSDNPVTYGASNYPQEFYTKCVTAANKSGYSVRLHAIGDAAVRMALNAFEESKKVNGELYKEVHNAIEHIESIHPEDIERFGKCNVIASVQPYHLTLDVNEKIQSIGKERSKYEWPFRTMIDQESMLALGTDCPVVLADPFANIYSAVSRCNDDGRPTGINPEEKMTLYETLRAYTLGAL